MTQEQKQELEQIIANLKTGGCSNPGSHGKIFEEILKLIKPKNILEIGFFTGASATMWLELTKDLNTKLTSVDPFLDNSTNDYLHSVGRPEEIGEVKVQLASVDTIYNNYKDRFRFVHKRSLAAAIDGDLSEEKYDLCFIDGEHSEAYVTMDLNICLALKIPFILLDDYNEMYNGVRIALAKMKNRFLPLREYTEQKDGSDVMFAANLDIVKIENN